jgi:hypothetical protein
MTSSSRQPFSCTIPNVQIEQERLEREKEEHTREETEQDIQATIDKGISLLEPLDKNCIRFFANVSLFISLLHVAHFVIDPSVLGI